MKKTTFGEICNIMKRDSGVDRECIRSVLRVGLLVLPGLICRETAVMDSLSDGVNLLGAAEAVVGAGGQIARLFEHQKPDFISRYERAQAAQVLLVFSAYFDSFRLYLPDASGKIALSSGEKTVLSQKSIEKYAAWAKEQSARDASPGGREILNYALDLPAPLQSPEQYQKHLESFYKILNKEFLEFFNKLDFWEQLPEWKKEKSMAALRKLPNMAVQNYKKQFFQLQADCADFKVWADIQAYAGVSAQIDVGFTRLAGIIENYFGQFPNRGADTLEKLAIKYRGYIADKLLETEMDSGSPDDVGFPIKKDIFIPQTFKALQYERGMQLEPEKTWDELDELDHIGQFIVNTLRHSATGGLPLLILGVPGAGKTLLCHMLAARLLSHEYHVLIIRLRDTVADDTIAQQINDQLERDFANNCTWDELAGGAAQKPILLIFDGYDELLQASGRTYADYMSKIIAFQKEQLNYGVQVKCILTSRATLIDKAIIARGTTVIKLLDFDEDRINKWAEIWNSVNRQYFEDHALKPFSIKAKSKVYELARQPLLLVLLALYDSNGNALKNENMTGAQLYDKLIRDFIEREKKKDPRFSSFPMETRKEIVDKETHKVSVAALGMYNRNVLYIRGEQLERDLLYLRKHADSPDTSQPGALKESELVLGSFFFIHRSDYRESPLQAGGKSAAYEFLHNTFGEFLTAHFIMNELCQKLRLIDGLQRMKMLGNWTLKPVTNWFAGLSYAPLSSRPIVVKMIHEWSLSFFNDRGLDTEKVAAAIHFLLTAEVDRIISGEDILTLSNVLTENGNPFEKRDSLTHLGIYSINLLCLGAIVCGEEHAFYCPNGIWDKLICLWRYALTEEELLNFANIFRARRDETRCHLSYLLDEIELNNSYMRIRRLGRIGTAIGDTVSSSLIAAIRGDQDESDVLSNIEQNDLRISSVFLWNRVLLQLQRGFLDDMSLESGLRKLQTECLERGGESLVLSYYLLLNHLLENRTHNIGEEFFLQAFEAGLHYLEHYERNPFFVPPTSSRFADLEAAILLMSKRLPLSKMNWPLLLDSCLHSCTIPGFYMLLDLTAREALAGEIKRNLFADWLMNRNTAEMLDSYLLQYPDAARVPDDELTAILSAIYHILSLHMPRLDSAVGIWFSAVCRFLGRGPRALLPEHQALLIRCAALREEQRWYTLEGIWRDVSMKKMYRVSPDTAYDLCCLLKREMFLDPDRVARDLMWILQHHAEDMPIKLYRSIQELAPRLRHQKLEQLLNRIEGVPQSGMR